VLLPVQEEPGTPVLLACDDETIRTVADRIGFDFPDPSSQFGRDVAIAFNVGRRSGWRAVTAGPWAEAQRPRELPAFFPVLCLWVLAATRMGPDEKHPTMEYHGRLCELIGVPGDDSLECFHFIGRRFHDLAEWLEQDMQGRHGRLIVPENPHPAHVGFAVEQTVFRRRDRQVLSVFFMERLRSSLDGFDPLRLLQRWSGRGRLTAHALRLVEDSRHEERVRAAIRAAFAHWDGAELVETTGGGVGRLWSASVRLRVYPRPHLEFGAANQTPVVLTIAGEELTLEPGRELALPWDLLDRATSHPVDLGDPRSAAGGIRIPRLGDTIVFESGEEGLIRVERPSDRTVWVLSRNGTLHERLRPRKFNDGGALPFGWELFYDVPPDDLPGVDHAPVATAQQALLWIEGGLSLGRRRYLSGYKPYLIAADVEVDSPLRVLVNGDAYGTIASGERLALPSEPGRYDIDVGDGFYRTSYDVETHGEPVEEQLCHHLSDARALRVGARPVVVDEPGVVTVCGATVTPSYSGALPVLTRLLCDVETICADGSLVAHRRPPTPTWFKEIDLGGGSRWELFCENPIWLLAPLAGGRRRARLLRDVELRCLDEAAARRVVEWGEAADVQHGATDAVTARARWKALVELAQQRLGGIEAA